MRSRLPSWVRFGLVLAVVAGTQVGCSSGWKMPGSDMFSWKRKPSESTLTGSGPSIQMPSGNASSLSSTAGSSPASRNTPTTINSTAVNGGRQSGPYGQSSNAANGAGGLSASTVGYQTPVTPANTNRGMIPGAGGAASSNGFSTPYSGQITPAAYPTPNPNAGLPNTAPPNPYSVAPAPTPLANPPSAQFTPGAYGLPPAVAALPPTGVTGLPPSPSAPNYGGATPTPYASSNPYAPTGGSSVPTMPVSYGAPASPPAAPAMSPAALPVAYGGTAPSFAPPSFAPASPSPSQASPSAPANTSLGSPTPARASMSGASSSSYQPGSTARPTNYEFSNVGPGSTGPGN